MDIKGKSVLILGGWGLVGFAIARRIIVENPSKIILASLNEWEAKEAVENLSKEFPDYPKENIIPWWGNIFLRQEWKDQNKVELLKNPEIRKVIIDDILEELNDEILRAQSLYQLIVTHKPAIIIDSINTATGIAYQNIYSVGRDVKKAIKSRNLEQIIEQSERLLATLYVPQLIRHVQILYKSMEEAETKAYIKIGTSGTGGMGLNIPYTHSEERPSRVLLSKSSVAGAHTLLLFLLARTPKAPITKEIKPTAVIAWKKIGYGEIKKGGKPIELLDQKPELAIELQDTFKIKDEVPVENTGETLKAVYIDTGENGIFSRAEFDAITSLGQMEYVTPEEIAETVVFEIKGGNTGHDIINALDHATLEPTYRAGYMQNFAISKMKRLEQEHQTDSVAFEMLGPPRLSKLLYEAEILKILYGSILNVIKQKPEEIAQKAEELIKSNRVLRSQIISIGIPILMKDGKKLIRGPEIKIPPYRGENELQITPENIDLWAHDGWVDLREKNFALWIKRFNQIIEETEKIPQDDTSSRFVRNREFWNNYEEIDIGKVVGWLFIYEESGERMKS
ncbi:MAG: short-chain dehydrogenase [Ignavibacteria bacterium]|nr:short-chain dehydrogenase [Ignavibacteria bacterium]